MGGVSYFSADEVFRDADYDAAGHDKSLYRIKAGAAVAHEGWVQSVGRNQERIDGVRTVQNPRIKGEMYIAEQSGTDRYGRFLAADNNINDQNAIGIVDSYYF